MTRQISGLLFVEELAGRPSILPAPRPNARKKCKQDGLRYEECVANALARRFPCAQHGMWLRFRDVNGWGYAQPDVVLRGSREVVIVECKLTYTKAALRQLEGLYMPLLEMLWGLPTRGIVACRGLTREIAAEDVCGSFPLALAAAKQAPSVWHWLGRGAVG